MLAIDIFRKYVKQSKSLINPKALSIFVFFFFNSKYLPNIFLRSSTEIKRININVFLIDFYNIFLGKFWSSPETMGPHSVAWIYQCYIPSFPFCDNY